MGLRVVNASLLKGCRRCVKAPWCNRPRRKKWLKLLRPRRLKPKPARNDAMADFFIRRPIVAIVIAILTVIVGFVSLKRLPISEYPPVSPTLIQVTTTYRGAAAEAVMQSVATPIESKVNGVD